MNNLSRLLIVVAFAAGTSSSTLAGARALPFFDPILGERDPAWVLEIDPGLEVNFVVEPFEIAVPDMEVEEPGAWHHATLTQEVALAGSWIAVFPFEFAPGGAVNLIEIFQFTLLDQDGNAIASFLFNDPWIAHPAILECRIHGEQVFSTPQGGGGPSGEWNVEFLQTDGELSISANGVPLGDGANETDVAAIQLRFSHFNFPGADVGFLGVGPVIVNDFTDPPNAAADLNGDGIVDGADLAFLLANWGMTF